MASGDSSFCPEKDRVGPYTLPENLRGIFLIDRVRTISVTESGWYDFVVSIPQQSPPA